MKGVYTIYVFKKDKRMKGKFPFVRKSLTIAFDVDKNGYFRNYDFIFGDDGSVSIPVGVPEIIPEKTSKSWKKFFSMKREWPIVIIKSKQGYSMYLKRLM